MKIKIGEAQARMVTNISKESEPRILFRANYKNANKSTEVAFKPAEDLKTGDEIRVTIEKISAAPKVKADKG
jgi:hypothetical protein